MAEQEPVEVPKEWTPERSWAARGMAVLDAGLPGAVPDECSCSRHVVLAGNSSAGAPRAWTPERSCAARAMAVLDAGWSC